MIGACWSSTRFRVPAADAGDVPGRTSTRPCRAGGTPGYVDGTVGRNVDDPELWVLTTRWEHVGAYRRALSAYDVKLHAVPTLSRALDEPSAYEVVEPGSDLNVDIPRRSIQAVLAVVRVVHRPAASRPAM